VRQAGDARILCDAATLCAIAEICGKGMKTRAEIGRELVAADVVLSAPATSRLILRIAASGALRLK
jgi:hypothetical protein